MKTKTCTKCKETKQVSEFHKDKNRKDGLRPYCKECVRRYHHRHYEANKEKIAEKTRKYQEANKEKIAESKHRYYEANKEKINERISRWREANKEKVAEINRRRYEANKSQSNRQSNKHSRKLNNLSLELAHRQGQPWEDWEDEFVMADNGLTIYQKAVKLGRSRSSVHNKQFRLREKARNELTPDTVRV